MSKSAITIITLGVSLVIVLFTNIQKTNKISHLSKKYEELREDGQKAADLASGCEKDFREYRVKNPGVSEPSP